MAGPELAARFRTLKASATVEMSDRVRAARAAGRDIIALSSGDPNIATDSRCIGATRDGAPLPAGAKDLEGNRLPQAPGWQYTVSGQYTFPISEQLEITTRTDYKWQTRVYFDIYNNPQNSQADYGLLNASLSIGSRNNAWELAGWVRNAFDKRYISSANAGSGANAPITGSLGTPRMYGATLYTRF